MICKCFKIFSVLLWVVVSLFLMIYLEEKMFLILIKFNISLFLFDTFVFGIRSKKKNLPNSNKMYSYVFFWVFIVLAIHLVPGFILHYWYKKKNSTSFFYMWKSYSLRTMSKEIILSPNKLSWYRCQKSIKHKYKGLFLNFQFCSTDLYVYPYLVPPWLNYCNFEVSFKMGRVSHLSFFLFQGCFGYAGSFEFSHES